MVKDVCKNFWVTVLAEFFFNLFSDATSKYKMINNES